MVVSVDSFSLYLPPHSYCPCKCNPKSVAALIAYFRGCQVKIVAIFTAGNPMCAIQLPMVRHSFSVVKGFSALHVVLTRFTSSAICNKCSDDVAGCRLYVIAFPSSDSAKVIIQSRIKEVIVLQREGSDQTAAEHNVDLQASRILLDMANVQVRYFKPSTPSVTLDFVSKLAPSTVPESESASSDCASGNAASDKLAEARARALLLSEANYDASKVEDNGRRKDYISWQDYFMAMAFLTAERSKDPNTQVG